MARTRRLFLPGLLYHVVARGNHRQPTFLAHQDYVTYLNRLVAYQQRYDVALYAYCLMPNHVHLLLQTSETPLDKFMQGLQQSYTQYFNLAYDKVGHLFQGRYKAIICQTDEYLTTLVRYIHLNPVRAGLVTDPLRYPYSGHWEYMAAAAPHAVLLRVIDTRPVLDVLGGPTAYESFVRAAHHGDDGPEGHIQDQQFLGAGEFAQRIRQQTAQANSLVPKKLLSSALDELAELFGYDSTAIRGDGRSRPIAATRAMIGFILVRRLGYRLTDVAAAMGRDPAGLSAAIRHVTARRHSGDHIEGPTTGVNGKLI